MRFLRVGLVAAACLALPSVASATITKAPNGHRLSVMLRHGVRGGGSKSGGGVLLQHTGPVLQAEAPYLIYWTPSGYQLNSTISASAASEGLLNRYLGDVAAASVANSKTNVYSVLGQYGAPYKQTFSAGSQAVTATDAYPGTGCSVASGTTACVSDASIQAEISTLISRGKLPAPTAPGSGTTPIYFVVTPVSVNVCTSTNSCVNNSFCAYHSYFSVGGQDALYASVPFSVFATSGKGCQTDQYTPYETPAGTYHGDYAYNVADDLSHELSETITDPLINAWYSKNGLEVGDLCEAYGPTVDTARGYSPLAYSPAFGTASAGTLYDQVINGNQYYNQTEFSNSGSTCLAGTTAL